MDLGVIMILGTIQQRLGVIILMEFACGDRRIWGRKLGQPVKIQGRFHELLIDFAIERGLLFGWSECFDVWNLRSSLWSRLACRKPSCGGEIPICIIISSIHQSIDHRTMADLPFAPVQHRMSRMHDLSAQAITVIKLQLHLFCLSNQTKNSHHETSQSIDMEKLTAALTILASWH